MKAEELMIGDWVLDIKSESKIQVAGLTPKGKIQEGWANGSIHSIDPAYIEPIPLTKKILELNGWQYGDWGNEYESDEYYHITIENKDMRYCVEYDTENKKMTVNNCWFVKNKLLHVHELQHALRLCGIEKEIKL